MDGSDGTSWRGLKLFRLAQHSFSAEQASLCQVVSRAGMSLEQSILRVKLNCTREVQCLSVVLVEHASSGLYNKHFRCGERSTACELPDVNQRQRHCCAVFGC